MEQIVHEFLAWECDGAQHTVQVVQTYRQVSERFKGTHVEQDRVKALRTTGGESVANPGPGVLGLKRNHEFIPLRTDDPMTW